MKVIIIGMAMLSSSFTACSNDQTSAATETKALDTVHNTHSVAPAPQDSASIDPAITEYLKLKNALIAGKSKDAAAAATSLKTALDNLGNGLMSEAEKKAFTNLGDDTKEHAEHIGKASTDLKHQREHFQMLSKDIYDLVKAFGTSQPLYKDYCPMVKAIWLSEVKPIKNPYYGNSMLTCGEVQETIH